MNLLLGIEDKESRGARWRYFANLILSMCMTACYECVPEPIYSFHFYIVTYQQDIAHIWANIGSWDHHTH